MGKYDPLAGFKSLSKDAQRRIILDIASLCIDAAPVGLARRIEIYLDNDECPYDCGYCHPDDV